MFTETRSPNSFSGQSGIKASAVEKTTYRTTTKEVDRLNTYRIPTAMADGILRQSRLKKIGPRDRLCFPSLVMVMVKW